MPMTAMIEKISRLSDEELLYLHFRIEGALRRAEKALNEKEASDAQV